MERITSELKGPELWIKRDDLTGPAGGGNKTRKLEFLVGDALRAGADTLVAVGALQSNHTRQTAAAAARTGMQCALLHNEWTPDRAQRYRAVGNLLMSEVMGARLYVDRTPRTLGQHGRLDELVGILKRDGLRPYVIPRGGSDHPLGSVGYMLCAAEIVEQSLATGRPFDYLVHCTGSSGTQAGLLAGFAVLGADTRVIGISDDDDSEVKRRRIQRLANETLTMLGFSQRITDDDVEVIVCDKAPYGVATPAIIGAIRRLARAEGILTDPVYEGRAVLGLLNLVADGRLQQGHRTLLMHLGGVPAIHAYSSHFGVPRLQALP